MQPRNRLNETLKEGAEVQNGTQVHNNKKRGINASIKVRDDSSLQRQ
jgi:hypothetical protein